MDKEYKIVSENTIQYISFHDCLCSKLYYSDNALVFDMKWLEVLPQHPENPYTKAHQSGVGKVILQSPTLELCELFKTPEEKTEIHLLDEINLCNVILLNFDVEEDKNGFSAEIFLNFDGRQEYEVATIGIKYEKSYVMWNELNGISWFEEEKWKNI